MCYSIVLTRENAPAHLAAHGWVYEGRKLAWQLSDGGLMPLHEAARRYRYRTGTLLRDRHGFHLAPTAADAMDAAVAIMSPREDCLPYDAPQDAALVVISVLVPEAAIEADGHVAAMVVLEPGSPVTDRLVALADGVNAAAQRRAIRAARLRDRCAALRDKLAAAMSPEPIPESDPEPILIAVGV